MNVFELEKLEGHRLPPGTYRIEPDAHTQMTEAIHAGNYNFDSAHPVYAHLAPIVVWDGKLTSSLTLSSSRWMEEPFTVKETLHTISRFK